VVLQHVPGQLSDAATVLERCDRLNEISEEDGRLVRRFGTDALARAHELVGGWMREAGMSVRHDAVGNMIARLGDGDAPALALGSHLDSVVDAGRYDGPLGVLVGLAVVERLGPRPPFPLEVLVFADEEGVRFGTSYLGSAAMIGRFDPAWPELRDADGIALADLLRGDPATAARGRDELRGYVEVHIEQGPRLERRDLPVGVVSAISSQTHGEVAFRGEAGHAGTVPMEGRLDALCAAAEFVLAAEDVARGGVVATVGRLDVAPGARNVIPARAAMTLDLRHAEDEPRRAAVRALHARAERIAARRGVRLHWEESADLPAVPMSPELAGGLAAAIEALGFAVERLPSGAGHDAAPMSTITPAAMLFVRCRGGISHHPDESVEEDDVAVAIDVVERLVRGL
jgi:allantoate deiminase